MIWNYSYLLSVNRLICNQTVDEEDTFDTFPLIPGLKSVLVRGLKLLSNIANLNHVEDIDLTECNTVKDISPLTQAQSVTIDGCSKIQDFSCLRNQKNVQIAGQYHLTDITGFSMVQSLSLFACKGLPADLSPLKGIPKLSLSLCAEVNDISQLGNHYFLSISNCSPLITGYEILLHIPRVALRECDISDVTVLRYARYVSLRDCHDITDISSLANIESLYLSNCCRVTDIDAVSCVKHLTLGWLPALGSVEGLKHHRSLEISCNGFEIITDLIEFLDQFPSMRSLKLCRVHGVTSCLSTVSNFSSLQRLSIDLIMEEFKLAGCEHINYVCIRFCHGLTSLEGLGRNREVHLSFLTLICDVSVLVDVPIVTIAHCENVKDISCLSKVPRLKFIPKS